MNVDELRADDADDAEVPFLVMQHDSTRFGVGIVLGAFGEFLERLFEDGAFLPPTLFVELAELVDDVVGTARIGSRKQLDRELGVAHAAGGVDARRKAIRDFFGVGA